MFQRWLAGLLLLPAVAAQNETNQTAAPGGSGGIDTPTGLVSTIVDEVSHRLPGWLQFELATFVITLLAWAAFSAVVVLLLLPGIKWLTSRTKTELDDVIVSILGRPLFYLIFVYGTVDSLLALNLPVWVDRWLFLIWRVVLIIQLTYIVYKLWKEVLLAIGRTVAKKTTTELDDKLYPFFSKVGGIVIILVGTWQAISQFGFDMTWFAAGGAIGGLVIAFAAQDTLANFFAGVQILLDRPFREGDRIEIKEEQTWGDVIEIGLRTTKIRTRDNRMVIVPNAVIGTNPVINHSYPDDEYRLLIEVGVAYGTDVAKAKEVIQEAVRGVEGVQDRPVQVLFLAFGESQLTLHVRYWIHHYLETRFVEDRVNTAIYNGLNAAGIEIPFPQRVLWNGAKPEQPVIAEP